MAALFDFRARFFEAALTFVAVIGIITSNITRMAGKTT